MRVKDVLRGISHFLPELTYGTLISQLYGRLPLELTEYYLIISYRSEHNRFLVDNQKVVFYVVRGPP